MDKAFQPSLSNQFFNSIAEETIVFDIVTMVTMVEAKSHRITALQIGPHSRRLGELVLDLHQNFFSSGIQRCIVMEAPGQGPLSISPLRA